MGEWDECKACYKRAKEGFVRLLGKHSAKAVEAALQVAIQIPSDDERIVEFRRLRQMAKVSLPEEAVTYDIANNLGAELDEKGKYEEAKVFWLAALEGWRRVLGEEHKKTLGSLGNMGNVLGNMKDYEGALGYFQQAFRVQEKVLGKTHPDTLMTIMNMGGIYCDGEKDFVKAEEMFRQALDGYERSLGKDQEDTKRCAYNLAMLLSEELRDREKTREHAKEYPHILMSRCVLELLRGEER
jgi:tetratricopeptide (TPR) repeat protein